MAASKRSTACGTFRSNGGSTAAQGMKEGTSPRQMGSFFYQLASFAYSWK